MRIYFNAIANLKRAVKASALVIALILSALYSARESENAMKVKASEMTLGKAAKAETTDLLLRIAKQVKAELLTATANEPQVKIVRKAKSSEDKAALKYAVDHFNRGLSDVGVSRKTNDARIHWSFITLSGTRYHDGDATFKATVLPNPRNGEAKAADAFYARGGVHPFKAKANAKANAKTRSRKSKAPEMNAPEMNAPEMNAPEIVS